MKGNKINELAWKDNIRKRLELPTEEYEEPIRPWMLILNEDSIGIADGDGVEMASVGGAFTEEDFREIAAEFHGEFDGVNTIELSRENAYAFLKAANPELELDEESFMNKGKRVREEASEFESEDDIESEGGEFDEDDAPEFEDESEEEFEGEMSDEDFDDEEFEGGDDDGIDAGEITIDGKRYCVVLYEIEDDEAAEEEAEGETPKEQAEEGEEGEAEEEIAEDEDFHRDNPFAAREEELKEEELEEAVKLGLTDSQILKLYQ
jgi:hypothetical protein